MNWLNLRPKRERSKREFDTPRVCEVTVHPMTCRCVSDGESSAFPEGGLAYDAL